MGSWPVPVIALLFTIKGGKISTYVLLVCTSRKKKNGQDATPIMEKMRALGDEIDALDAQVKKAEETIRTSLLAIPNIPNESVPFE